MANLAGYEEVSENYRLQLQIKKALEELKGEEEAGQISAERYRKYYTSLNDELRRLKSKEDELLKELKQQSILMHRVEREKSLGRERFLRDLYKSRNEQSLRALRENRKERELRAESRMERELRDRREQSLRALRESRGEREQSLRGLHGARERSLYERREMDEREKFLRDLREEESRKKYLEWKKRNSINPYE